MGSEEAGELIVQTDSVGPESVGEGVPIVVIIARVTGNGEEPRPHGVLSEPVIQSLALKTPVAVERIFEAEAADPAPTPIITSPDSFVVITRSVKVRVIVIVTAPCPVGKSTTGSRIEKSPVIVERDTQASANRSHEIDLGTVGKTIWPFSLLKTLCVDAVSLDVGGRAGEVSFNAEDEILPLIIVANLATADESCLSELTRAGPLIIPDVSVGEVRVKLAYAGVDTD